MTFCTIFILFIKYIIVVPTIHMAILL